VHNDTQHDYTQHNNKICETQHNNKIYQTHHNNKNYLLSIILCQVSSRRGVKMLKVILWRVNKIKSVIFTISLLFAVTILASIKYEFATNTSAYYSEDSKWSIMKKNNLIYFLFLETRMRLFHLLNSLVVTRNLWLILSSKI
jgi:hypothetical protein